MKHEKPPPPRRAIADSLLLRLFCRPPTSPPRFLLSLARTCRAGRHSIPVFSVPAVSLHPTLNVLPDHQPPGWLFQSPVRWRYNDHRHVNHGPAETCIFMSAAHSLSLSLTLRLSFPETYTGHPRLSFIAPDLTLFAHADKYRSIAV